ncbi:MAG: S41 family peptidase [Bacteroidaceae bacterium]|nr:S41 family peptidase [Bacteroidaceae bacterium]
MRTIYIFIGALALSLQAAAQKRDNHHADVFRNIEIFSQVYQQLDSYYVDTLSVDSTIEWAIRSMLAHVDPYTDYYPANDETVQQLASGNYGGTGSVIQWNEKEKRAMVSEPLEGTPSSDAGLRAGDVILTVDGKDVLGMNTTEVTKLMRGEPGSTYELRVKRYGVAEPISFKINRRLIHQANVPYYALMSDGVGYILLTSFTENAAQETRKALLDLKQQGMSRLVLDLRDNPGGSLEEAVSIVNLFVPRGHKVVYTKGKVRAVNREYYTATAPIDTITPMVVLVNSGSASAAEIVSGSLQDMDRAVIMGTRTYGKGFVQNIRQMPYGSNMKITVSRYYIPSGRCIQARNYRHLNADGSVGTVPDSLTKVFHTRNGREVRDGGGIKPDIELKPDSFPSFLYDVVGSPEFFDYCTCYVAEHETIAPAGEFEVSDADYAAFADYMVEQGFEANRRSEHVLELLEQAAKMEGYYADAQQEFEALNAKLKGNLRHDLEHMKTEVKSYLGEEIVTRYYFRRGAYQQQLRSDKEYQRAAELLNDESAYHKILQP